MVDAGADALGALAGARAATGTDAPGALAPGDGRSNMWEYSFRAAGVLLEAYALPRMLRMSAQAGKTCVGQVACDLACASGPPLQARRQGTRNQVHSRQGCMMVPA